MTDLVGAIESRTDIPKGDDETLKEYLERVGEETETDPAVVEAAVEFVIQSQYGTTPPTDDRPIQEFLGALAGDPEPPAEPAGEGSGENPETAPAVGGEESTPIERFDPSGTEVPPSLEPVGSRRRRAAVNFKGGLRGREPRRLLLWTVVMLATAPVVGWMLGRTWVPGHDIYDGVGQTLADVLGLSFIGALELAGVVGIGLYAALVVLFIADVKKRVQGMLLLLGSLLAGGVLVTMGVLVPNIDFAAPVNIGGLLFGLLVGLALEAGELQSIDWGQSSFRRPTVRGGDVAEFRVAVYGLFGVIAILLVMTVVQAGIAGVLTGYDVVAGVVFLVMAYRFVGYDSELTYLTLGPAQSGKSMLALGLCLELLEADGPHPKPNGYLKNALERVGNLAPGRERWPLPSTPPDVIEVSSLELIVGYYFPRRIEVTALDYAGQHLPRIVELIETDKEETDEESVPAEVADWIASSHTLMVILDVERLVHPERFRADASEDGEPISWGFEQYASILEAREPAEVMVVATKCDVLLHEGIVDPPTEFVDWAGFREAVTGMLADRPDVAELLDMTNEDAIQPVFYVTERADGTYVPKLDGSGNLMPVGYGHLIEAVGRRQ